MHQFLITPCNALGCGHYQNFRLKDQESNSNKKLAIGSQQLSDVFFAIEVLSKEWKVIISKPSISSSNFVTEMHFQKCVFIVFILFLLTNVFLMIITRLLVSWFYNHPKENLIKFGYNLNMKFLKIYILWLFLKPCVRNSVFQIIFSIYGC